MAPLLDALDGSSATPALEFVDRITEARDDDCDSVVSDSSSMTEFISNSASQMISQCDIVANGWSGQPLPNSELIAMVRTVASDPVLQSYLLQNYADHPSLAGLTGSAMLEAAAENENVTHAMDDRGEMPRWQFHLKGLLAELGHAAHTVARGLHHKVNALKGHVQRFMDGMKGTIDTQVRKAAAAGNGALDESVRVAITPTDEGGLRLNLRVGNHASHEAKLEQKRKTAAELRSEREREEQRIREQRANVLACVTALATIALTIILGARLGLAPRVVSRSRQAAAAAALFTGASTRSR